MVGASAVCLLRPNLDRFLIIAASSLNVTRLVAVFVVFLKICGFVIFSAIGLHYSLVMAADDPSTEKFVLISDVDDTLKDTRTRSWIGMLNRGVRAKNAFSGMSDLYLRWRAASLTNTRDWERCIWSRGLNGREDRLIVYVTAALGRIQWFPNLFLVYSKFPVGEFIGRWGMTRKDFKMMQLQEQIEQWDDRTIVLIGDNGEFDADVFSEMRKLFPQRKIISFVHMVYPIAVDPSHHVFYTAADLAVWFYKYGWISREDVEYVVQKVSSKVVIKPHRVLPRWVQVRDLESHWPELDGLDLSQTATNCLNKLRAMTKARSLN